MTSIVDFAVKNWRITIGIMIFMVLGGIVAMKQLALDAEPDIPVPFINVQVVLPGVSPEDSERLLIRPMETELKSVEGLKQMNAIAATSVGAVVLEFNASFDADQTISNVLEKVDRARADFPSEAREPIVEELNTATFPIIIVNLYGDAPDRELQRRAKDLQQKLESISSILEANISGERERVLEAVLDPALLDSSGVSFGEIAQTVATNNALITAGSLETNSGKFNVKLPGLIDNAAALSELVVRTNQNGSVIRIKDLGVIREGFKDIETYAQFNGKSSVSIEVTKRQGENVIKTIEKVRALIDGETSQANWPETINVTLSQDSSEQIYEMVTSLFSSIVNAVVLVFIVCIAALGLRSALFVGWAIPASFMMALFLFLIQGETLNMMIMFGLILSVGVLVDSAIVIVEYADRKLAEGLDRRAAYTLAGKRMFWPIVSSTATTLAAFIPFLFWDDVTGKYMAFFPKTMIFVLSSSLVMALIFLPTMGAFIGPRTITKDVDKMKALSGADGDPAKIGGLTGLYIRLIKFLVTVPSLVIAATAIMSTLIIMAFSASLSGDTPKPVEFFNNDPGFEVYVIARARGNGTADQDLALAQEIERRIDGIEGIRSFYTIAGVGAVGSSEGGAAITGPSNIPGDAVVRIFTELLPFVERPSAKIIMDDIRDAVKNIPGVYTEVTSVSFGPPVGKDLEIQLSSDDAVTLAAATESVRQRLNQTDGLIDIEDTRAVPGIEWELQIDREEAGRLGLDISTIGAAIQFVTDGALVGQYRPLDADEEVDIRIRYPSSSRNLKLLETLRIITPQGAIPLSTVVKRKAKPRKDKITRRDQKLIYDLKANTLPDYATNIIVDDLRTWFENTDVLPLGVEYKFLGQDEENASAAVFFQTAAIAILFMMAVILLLQFNSFYHVFLTLLAVILSLLGVILGLTFYHYVSVILCGTGVFALAGIVVNNNIVLIDTYQRLIANDYSPADAAVRTAAQRLRPVLLTTITTVVGLMPLVLGWQADIFHGTFSTKGTSTSSIWAPISYVIVCGLSFATILTLIITPVLLAAPSIWGERLKRVVSKQKSSSAAALSIGE
ncbi:MAG: efflux RND transporter permease subunit [Maricaulaceae bacterium]